jgi:hypothetical protein
MGIFHREKIVRELEEEGQKDSGRTEDRVRTDLEARKENL